MNENEISKVIVDAALDVHRTLGGPGLLEAVYEEALALELEEVVEQGDEEGFARFGAEDPLEDEVGLGVGEDREHAAVLRLQGGGCHANAGVLRMEREEREEGREGEIGIQRKGAKTQRRR